MVTRGEFHFYDLRSGTRLDSIELLFPGWQTGDERLVVLSPHDDDGLLGAGLLMQAVAAAGGTTHLVIFCAGDAGYSDPSGRDTIVERRRAETTAAYGLLGLRPQDITRLDIPDFSVLPRIGRLMPWGGEGTFATTVPLLRRLRATRLAIPNRYREHVDHEAVGRIGAFDGPQAGDPMLVDWGEPHPVRSFLEYAVWGDFSPEDELASRQGVDASRRGTKANRALLAPAEAEERVREALARYASQLQIIAGLVEAREGRGCAGGFLEVFQHFDARPALSWEPYRKRIAEIDASRGREPG
jgi:LmbE family N-acetylglucosaminyl deacetylase